MEVICNEAGGHQATFSVPEVPVGDTDTIVVVATLPGAENWVGTPTVDLDRIQFWAINFGYGAIGISDVDVVVAGDDATVTFQLDRTIYGNEVLSFEFANNWIVDTDLNYASLDDGLVTNSSGASEPATTTKASWGKISIELAAARPLYHSLVGAPHFDLATGVGGATTIVSRLPAQTTDDGLLVNGAQKNPVRDTASPAHGYDERHSWFGAGFVAALPISVSANDCVVIARHNPDHTTTYGGSPTHPVYTMELRGFQFIDGALGATEIGRPCIGYDGSSPRPARTIDVATILAGLPEYDTSGFAAEVPPVEDLERRYCQPIYSAAQFHVEPARQMTPAEYTHIDGYGLYMAYTANAVACKIISDEVQADKENLVLWTAYHGNQIRDGIMEAGSSLPPDGGQNQGKLFMVVAALVWLGMPEEVADVLDNIGTNELGQSFLIDQDYLDWSEPHSNSDTVPGNVGVHGPHYHAKRKTISGVSGTTITCAGMGSNESGNTYVGMLLVRESDDAEASITSFSNGVFVIDAQPVVPFIVTDVVTVKSPYAEALGDAQWGIVHSNHPQKDTPNNLANYRNLNAWCGQMLAIKALGFMHSNFAGFEEYVVRANTANTPAGFDFPTHKSNYTGVLDNVSYSFDGNMFDTHYAAISAITTLPEVEP